MDARLLNILNKLNIDKSHLLYFEGGKIENLVYNKDKKIYSIYLLLNEPLPASVYVATLDAFSSYLKQSDESVLVALYIKLNKPCYDNKIVKICK